MEYVSPDNCNACGICKKTWHFNFKPLWKDGLISFFECAGGMPCPANYDNIMQHVWRNEHWTKAIFDLALGSVHKYHVEAMFLQLIAVSFIAVQKYKGEMCWVICREKKKGMYPPFRWKNDDNWLGLYLQNPSSKRRWNVL